MPASLSLQQETMALTKCKDALDHKLMTMDEVKKHQQGIADLLALLQKSKKVYKDTMRRLDDKEAAQAASYEITGGLSKMWDKACDEGHIICMTVTCPSASDAKEMNENEEALRQLIYKIDPQLENFILDVFTRRKEIGQVRETTVIVRFPIYLSASVSNLAASLCITGIGSHKFKAWTHFKGRTKVSKKPLLDRWADATIGGKKIAEISSEELQSRSWKQLDGDALTTNLEQHYNAIFEAAAQDGGKVHEELEKHIWESEMANITAMQTWEFARDIIHKQNGPKAEQKAMLKMAGEIIRDFEGCYGQCTVFDGHKPWTTTTEAFLSNGMGNFFLTFDPIFMLAMAGNASGTLKQDAPGGIYAAFCIQFALNTSDNVTFSMLGAGIIFVQHCIQNPMRLSTLAHIMKEHLSVLACAMAAESASRLTCAAAAAPPVPQSSTLTAPADGDNVSDQGSDSKCSERSWLQLQPFKGGN